MSPLLKVREKEDKKEEPGGIAVPKDIKDRIKRGRDAMRKDAAQRTVCQKFWEGDQYWYVNSKSQLAFLPSAVIDVQRGKPLHRIRNTYNFIQSLVEGKVSAASQRVPGFQVDPSSTDEEDYEGARIAEQVAVWGYDEWWWRRETNKTLTNALVQREGFVYPHFDGNVGPFTQGPDGKWKGKGDIRLVNLTRSQVMWEPGDDFQESRWHAVERAMLPEDVKKIPGYIGGTLEPDAKTSDLPDDKKTDFKVAVVEFLERPCPDYPQGRRCWIADGRIVVDYRKDPDAPEDANWYEPFPFMDADGEVVDQPVLHRLSYTVNPNGDDLGLVERLLDLQRTVNDCWSKLLEWKNQALLPQLLAEKGQMMSPLSDVPGAIFEFRPGRQPPSWRPTPPIPRELFEILNMAIDQMRALAADIDVQPDPNLAAKTANAAIEASRARWQSFLADYADFMGRLMRHVLVLVARFFDQERVVQIRGQYGWEDPVSFTGADLKSQVNVRVLPGSIEARSREQRVQDLQVMAELNPGSVSPEAAAAVMNGGDAEGLLQSHEKDVARVWRVIRVARKGLPALMQRFPRYQDLEMGEAPDYTVPGWMPRKMDNIAVWKQVIADYCKTTDWDALPPETQHLFMEMYNALEVLEQRKAMQLMAQTNDVAASQGLGNAAAPQGSPGTPQMSNGLSPQQAAPASLSPSGPG